MGSPEEDSDRSADTIQLHPHELTEDVREVGRDTLEPIMFLLQSHDVEVQRAASAALGNLAVNSAVFVLIEPLSS